MSVPRNSANAFPLSLNATQLLLIILLCKHFGRPVRSGHPWKPI